MYIKEPYALWVLQLNRSPNEGLLNKQLQVKEIDCTFILFCLNRGDGKLLASSNLQRKMSH